MNKIQSKRSKVDKCPSIAHENKIKNVSKTCFLSEKSHDEAELKNGITNGIVEDDSLPVKKNNVRGKKSKQVDKSINIDDENKSEKIHLTKTAHGEGKVDQSRSKSNISKGDSTVNSVDSIENGTKKLNTEVDKLDTNDNISCDNNPSFELQIPKLVRETQSSNNVKKEQEASSSSTSICKNEDVLELSQTVSADKSLCDAEVSNSVENIQFKESEPKSEDDAPQMKHKIDFIQYESESQMPMIMKIIQKDLSEPYSIYTYRYFIHNWPKLCFLAMCEGECVGAIVCKLDLHRKVIRRGYIAMLAVDREYRKLRIGSNLVQMSINEMLRGDADEVVLETEVTNKPALQLYEKLGFVRDKRLFRYYLNGVDALRLKLWLR